MGRLDGKIAVVTGAYEGIGEGISRVFAKQGATVVLTDVKEEVKETANSISKDGFRAHGIKMDVTNTQQIKDVFQEILERYENRIDILVNNAAIFPTNCIQDVTDDSLFRAFNVNVFGMFRCSRLVVPVMIKQKYGKIVNMSSVTGPMVVDWAQTEYASTKAAVWGFTVALALEVAQHGINVNAICPGIVETSASRRLIAEENNPTSVEERGRTIPIGRMATPEEVGELALFLASDESKYLMGARIVIDGANSLQEIYRGPYKGSG